MKSKGFIFLIPLILIGIVIVSGIVLYKNKFFQLNTKSLPVAPMPTATGATLATPDQASTLNSGLTSTSKPTPRHNDKQLSVNAQLNGKLAFIRDWNLWFSNNGVEKQLTKDVILSTEGNPKSSYSHPQISPDGTKIAYLKYVNANTTNTGDYYYSLFVSAIDGKNVKQLASDLNWNMPIIQWSKNSQQVFYTSFVAGPTDSMADENVVKSVDVATGQKQEYGQFAVIHGCGGVKPDPSDGLSEDEDIIGVSSGPGVFNLSPQNNFIVHTINCLAEGLGIFDLSTKQDKKIDDKAINTVISPDGNSIAAILENGIGIFDVTTGKLQKTYSTSDKPMVLLWSADGKTIYYSSSKFVKKLDIDPQLSMDVFGSSGYYFNVNSSTLWRLSIDGGKNEKITDFDAHNVKPVFASDQRLLVVAVENSTDLFNYINQYKTDKYADEYNPRVKLLELNISNLSWTTVGEKVNESSFLP